MSSSSATNLAPAGKRKQPERTDSDDTETIDDELTESEGEGEGGAPRACCRAHGARSARARRAHRAAIWRQLCERGRRARARARTPVKK